jgi:hypothetical protein
MKRAPVAALSVAILALALLPASVQAAAGTLDQHADPGENSHLSDGELTQTFTAGMTGQLTQIELRCVTDTGGTGSVHLSVGSANASGECGGEAAGWVTFVFASPPAVVTGHVYTITFHCETPTHWSLAAADYTGGAPGGDPLPAIDFAFRTYVLAAAATQPPTTTAVESHPSSGPPIWWLPAALALALGSLVVVAWRRRDRIR